MKQIFAITIVGIAFSANASQVYVDSPVCHSSSSTVHGACVQNKTGSAIADKLMMIEEIFYLDGSSSYGMNNIATLHNNYYLDFFYTNYDYKKQKIKKVVFAVDYEGVPISDCIIELTSHNPNGKFAVSIHQNGEHSLTCSV